MKWDDVVDEKPSAEFRERVLKSAEAELKSLRPERKPFWARREFAFTSFAVLLAALIPALRVWRKTETPAAPPLALLDAELLDNSELLSQLDLLADLDVLQDWDEKEV